MHKAVLHPLSMIASDGIMEEGKGHPRAAGTFARIFGGYVREERVALNDGRHRKCSLMPAQRLEAMSPQMRQKGRRKWEPTPISWFSIRSASSTGRLTKSRADTRTVSGTSWWKARSWCATAHCRGGVLPGQGIRAK